MTGHSQYGPRNHIDELHDLPDAEREERFRVQAKLNPSVAWAQLATLTRRYGFDPLLFMMLSEETERRLVNLELEVRRLREKIG